MNGLARANTNRTIEASPPNYTVQVYDHSGRLLSEYALSPERQEVQSLAIAEQMAIANLRKSSEEDLVVVVTEDFGDGLRQVQQVVGPSVNNTQ